MIRRKSKTCAKSIASSSVVLLSFVLSLFIMISCAEETTVKSDVKSEQNQKVNLSELPPDGGPEYNRLIFHKSPYLLQHADNPVDWYPWGEEAFEKAKKENKPIFLSIGYSTCHWCHVMAHESFEDEEVAELLNKYFVAIKVDREERPDIDAIYMSVCLSMTGRGGWPLTIIMTPDKKPFLAGTYFPKTDNFGRPGLMTLLARVNKLWNERREDLIKSGEEIVRSLQASALQNKKGVLTEDTLKKAYETFQARFDENHGGFGGAPKFPSPHNLTFLLRWWYRTGEEKALQMVEKTLDEMRRGGMYDQIGYGFHRYSVDPEWLIPHFEKMLYDQALLALAYTEAYQATGKEAYAETVREIFTYVLRDMSSADGGFHSAENADSEGEEGKFYAWTPKEIKSALGENDGDLFCKFYGVTKKGNFEHGTSALHIRKPIEEFAKEKKIDAKELAKTLDRSRRKLLGVRDKRIRPSKDDKILTDWNGLMIAALAKGGRVLGEEKYIDAARRAADFLLGTLIREDGRLLHRYRDGEAAIEGFLDDYAFLVWGLLELYESTFDVKYLERAISFTNDMLSLFWDEKNGGLFLRVGDGEELITRIKEGYDGAIPSGNSIAALDLVRLWGMTMNKEYGEKAKELMESFGRPVNASPTGFAQLLAAFDFYLGPSYEIVIAGELEHENTQKMLREIHTRFIPRKVVLLHQPGAKGKPLEELSPFIALQTQMNDLPTAYVCQNFMCQMPTTDVRELGSLLTDNR